MPEKLINVFFLSKEGRGCTKEGREYIFEQVRNFPEYKDVKIQFALYSGSTFNNPKKLVKKLKKNTVVIVSEQTKGIYFIHGDKIEILKDLLLKEENSWDAAMSVTEN